jgi:hypothetical protein
LDARVRNTSQFCLCGQVPRSEAQILGALIWPSFLFYKEGTDTILACTLPNPGRLKKKGKGNTRIHFFLILKFRDLFFS